VTLVTLTRVRAAALAACLVPAALAASDTGDWPYHDHDAGGTRFSPLTQITPANVATLRPVWTFDAGVTGIQVTPLVVGGLMYVTAGRDITALEPESGKVMWKFTAPGNVSRRGVAYWPGDATAPPRLFSGAGDKMVAVDAESGKLSNGFGDGGYVDLKASIRGDVDGGFSLVSPPAVYKNIVITGGNNGEQSPSFGLYGDIRGWDARTGKLLWSFHTVPRAGEPGVETWEGDSWKNRSGTNMWAFFTIDLERGIVYVPLGAPTSDYYGGDRKGKGLYGNSLVALDATSGKLKWYQQLVHHDLWDFDLPAAPTLIDVKRNGRTIPAVAQVTKMSLLFIFDRVTGEPIFGMEERAVPKGNVPGEWYSPTQPFPVKPAPLGRTTFDPAKDFNALTPDHLAYCKDLWDRNGMYTNGPFTPPGTDGTMVTFPSTIGGGNWNGLSYDPTLGLVFTNVMNLGQVAKMVQGTDRSGVTTWVRHAPWGGVVGRFWNPDTKVPCSAPPFGELVAVNVNTGDIAWHVPIGFVEALKAKGFADTGALNIGGSIATASGLLFVGATIDSRFRAFDSKTGKLLWEATLDAPAHTVPMTFQGKDRRQYVVVAAGGGGYLTSTPGTKIVAFALPGATAAQPVAAQGFGPKPARKQVLAWGDVRNGYQHESISHAFATIERLGRESGAYDTYFRTDSQLITKHPIVFKTGTGIATGEQFLAHNLDYFDAIFFFGVREIDLTPEQRADLLAFIKDDGKGFVAAHSAATAFFSWPEFGDMLGGRFDEHPWGVTNATVVVDDPRFPAMKGFPKSSVFHDEHYQLKEFSRDKVRVLAHLDASKLDLHAPLVHRTDGDFPVAWAKTYGKGRVFYSTLGHDIEAWVNPVIQRMYLEAIRWSLGLVDGDATPAAGTPARAESEGLPQGPGRAAVVKMCSDCHGLGTAIASRRTRVEWQSVVQDMRDKGAPGSDEDSRSAVDYLSRYFIR
jgi:glucose dehydrogenase/type 1 glutamine amidotransferase